MLTKPLPCTWGNNMLRKLWWQNATHVSEDKRCFSTCVEQIPSHASADINCILTWYHYVCVNKCWPNPNVNQHVLTKHLPCQRGNKTHLIMCWLKPIPRQRGMKIYVKMWSSLPMTARTQNIRQHVITEPLTCQRLQKLHLSLFWPNPYPASEVTECILTCLDLKSPLCQ